MATANVIGRALNGVRCEDVCSVAATEEDATGMFVHIEQSAQARDKSVYGNWTKVFLDAFPL